jgi:hypothetical protein
LHITIEEKEITILGIPSTKISDTPELLLEQQAKKESTMPDIETEIECPRCYDTAYFIKYDYNMKIVDHNVLYRDHILLIVYSYILVVYYLHKSNLDHCPYRWNCCSICVGLRRPDATYVLLLDCCCCT